MMKLSPLAIATLALLLGCGLVVTGIWLLAGVGWAVLASGVPFLAAASVLLRGMTRGE